MIFGGLMIILGLGSCNLREKTVYFVGLLYISYCFKRSCVDPCVLENVLRKTLYWLMESLNF